MINKYAVILAAGQGTRMKSKLYKVLHPVMGRPMVQHIVDQLQALKLDKMVTVVGAGAEQVKDQLGDITDYVVQNQQLGTGHAVLQAEPLLKNDHGMTIVVCGDTPLLTKETLDALFEHHLQAEAQVTVLTTTINNPTGYGRIIRDQRGHVAKIIEQKDANQDQLLVKEINTGTYCFDNQFLFEALAHVTNDNNQGEYYLPDVIEIAQKQGHKVTAFQTADPNETLGVNDRVALATAEKLMKQRINEQHMRNGVTIIDPDHTYIAPTVKIASDAIIEPGSIIKGDSYIGSHTVIGPNSEVEDCKIGESTEIAHSVAHQSNIGSHVKIGPFAHIRPATQIKDQVKVGNFVEVKKSTINNGSKVSHLSYIGDTEIGKNVNIGCGVITVNYDGEKKYKTTIEDNVFIGCNANLIAPVTIGQGALVAAGSTINKDVPAESLSIARAKQENKANYAKKLNKLLK
ncbi:bifunctional UDP-N-acetylglucosamine diphosphorylase/glucosamine-1-phosphate N-acetyltransferase GlmU [Amphibacillus cookii]|uniref:bifunctional UDP-N-acetylglucosamine diphosphorylase/glucosamine-1-phosphate N-acetyltransferase GlmU n=1 Tax=Amphibacillus cookii TaxID=767787 RepID=UPI00195F0A37|nr:bifunctional UDP-N-acetylglucosamine diphosphorylase/glucosamine-1-phosphate N-acetyltransferase GlmU [Amphibacillus cookii]MBM7543156.1 bifunctional UDP-N-acetylglucosamine pyrophosphorylase/glucosamine-1-phosphate N-acetyltransferase [Amphibacillus cookii]